MLLHIREAPPLRRVGLRGQRRRVRALLRPRGAPRAASAARRRRHRHSHRHAGFYSPGAGAERVNNPAAQRAAARPRAPRAPQLDQPACNLHTMDQANLTPITMMLRFMFR